MATLRVTVSDRLRVEGDRPSAFEGALLAAFDHPNPDIAKAKRGGRYVGHLPKTIRTWALDGSTLVLPRGGTQRLREVAEQHGVALRWRDDRLTLPSVDFPPLARTLFPFQRQALDAILAREQGIVRAPTGSGKTTMALAGIAEVKQPALVVMRDSRLLDQWKRRAVAELGLSEREIGILRGGKRSIGKRLTLALQQTLNSATFPLDEILDRFGSVWVDEAQTVAARTFEAPLNRFRARVRVGFSADETRADRKEFLVYDTMGAVIHEVTLEEAEAAGVVVPVHVLVAGSDFAPPWYLAQGHGERDWNRLMSAVEGNPERNALIVRIVEQLLREGRAPVLVFTERREHARALADTALFQRGHRCGLLLGGDADLTRFTEDRLRLELGKLDIAVGTFDAIGQGIDLPRVRGGVIASPIGDNKQFFGQVRGRLARAFHEKTEAWLVYVLDEELFSRQRQRLKRWNRDDIAPFRHGG